MKFNIYSGNIAGNCSVNITKHGSFDADNKAEAIKLIEFNKKHRYCDAWQFPHPPYCSGQDKRIAGLHDNFRWKLFVCIGDPFERNVIWKDTYAVISFFGQSKKHSNNP